MIGLVILLGSLGVLCRFAMTQVFVNTSFPWSTLTVNLLGSLFIGGVYGLAQRSEILASNWLPAVTIGLLGGLTTYSSFALDSLRLLQEGRWALGGIYILTTNIGAIGLCLLGMKLQLYLR